MNQKNRRASEFGGVLAGLVLLAGISTIFAPMRGAYAQALAGPNPQAATPSTDAGTKGQLGEVIVTATRRSESVQAVPESVSVLTGTNLAIRNIVSVEQYTSTVPGLSFNQTGFGDRNGLDLTIRGISNTRLADSTAGTGALTTGFYLDDVAITPVDVYLYDVNRIEVLKGPQGTLFGQASMGGTVRVILNQPDLMTYSGTAEATVAETSGGAPSWSTKGVVNIPLISNQLAARVVAYNENDGGWIDWLPPSLGPGGGKGPIPSVPGNFPNPITTTDILQKDVNSTHTYGGRITLLYSPTENLSITPMYLWQDRSSPFSNFIERNLNEGYITQNYEPEPRDEQFSDSSLTIKYHFPFADLTSVTARFDRDYSWRQDTTSFIAATYGLAPNGGIASVAFLDFNFTNKIFSQELRLTSPTSKYLDWLVGAAYFDENRGQNDLWLAPTFDENVAPANVIPGGGADGFIFATTAPGDFVDRSVFGTITFKLFDSRFQISAGARHYKEAYDLAGVSTGALVGAVGTVTGAGVLNGGEQTGTIPRFAAKYMITDTKMLYATASKGFRAGGPGYSAVNETPACLDALQVAHVTPGAGFTSDNIWNYELGLKSTWNDGRLVTDFAVFDIDWNNLQTNLILNNYNVNCPGTVTTNGGKATSKGGEVSIAYRPVNSLTLTAAGSYTRAVLGQQPPGSTVGTDGEPLQNAPELQGTLSMQYNFSISSAYGGFLRGDESYYGWQWSNQASEPNPFFYVHARSLTGLRFGFLPTQGDWTIQLYIDNAFNREQEYGAQSYFGEPNTNQVLVGRPRTVGLMANYSW